MTNKVLESRQAIGQAVKTHAEPAIGKLLVNNCDAFPDYLQAAIKDYAAESGLAVPEEPLPSNAILKRGEAANQRRFDAAMGTDTQLRDAHKRVPEADSLQDRIAQWHVKADAHERKAKAEKAAADREGLKNNPWTYNSALSPLAEAGYITSPLDEALRDSRGNSPERAAAIRAAEERLDKHMGYSTDADTIRADIARWREEKQGRINTYKQELRERHEAAFHVPG